MVDRPRLYKTEAIILKQTPLGEADRTLTLYTPHLGKLHAIARGVRRPRSKLAGHLEPLTYARLMLARGRSLDVVAGAESLQSFVHVRQDLGSIGLAFYCAELVDAFTPEEHPNLPIFWLLLKTLEWLDLGEGDLLVRSFELSLLEHLGYLPELYRCVECTTDVRPNGHAFSLGGGGVVCPACYPKAPGPILSLSLNALKVLRYLKGKEYRQVKGLRVGTSLAAEVEGLLQRYILHLLEREVRSFSFLETLRKTQDAPPQRIGRREAGG